MSTNWSASGHGWYLDTLTALTAVLSTITGDQHKLVVDTTPVDYLMVAKVECILEQLLVLAIQDRRELEDTQDSQGTQVSLEQPELVTQERHQAEDTRDNQDSLELVDIQNRMLVVMDLHSTKEQMATLEQLEADMLGQKAVTSVLVATLELLLVVTMGLVK